MGLSWKALTLSLGLMQTNPVNMPMKLTIPGALYIEKKIEDVTGAELAQHYPEGHVKILVACAPCQPYSPYNKGKKDKDEKWKLLSNFADLISEIEPDIVSMENVPNLVTFQEGKVYQDFVERLERRLLPSPNIPRYSVQTMVSPNVESV